MLLTGFDAPIEQVMYIDKPLEEHNLLQAIARCNRTYANKDHGLIVDYYGLSSNLKKALSIFEPAEIAGVARPSSDMIPLLEAKHNACMQFFNSIDDLQECVEHLAPEDVRADFNRVFREFSKSLNNILPNPRALKYTPDHRKLSIIYLEALRRYDRIDATSLEGCGEKVKQLIDEHIIAHGINNLTKPVSLFSDEFLEFLEKDKTKVAQASEMEHTLKHTIRVKWDEDPVFWKSLKEKLDMIIKEYEANRFDDVHFLDELALLRNEIIGKADELKKEGFSFEAESAIWNVMDKDGEHKDIAKDIYQAISDLVVIDYEQKDDVMKGMRKTVKRKLREIKMEDIEAKTTAIINLLKVHGEKPDIWKQQDSFPPLPEAAEEDQNYSQP